MSFYWFVLLTLLFWGTAPLVDKIALRDVQPLTATMIRSIFLAIMMSALVGFSGQLGELRTINWKVIALIALGGLFAGGLGQWAYFMALKSERAALVVPLCAAYPAVTLILGLTLLGETLTLVRTIGALLIVGGAILVKLN